MSLSSQCFDFEVNFLSQQNQFLLSCPLQSARTRCAWNYVGQPYLLINEIESNYSFMSLHNCFRPASLSRSCIRFRQNELFLDGFRLCFLTQLNWIRRTILITTSARVEMFGSRVACLIADGIQDHTYCKKIRMTFFFSFQWAAAIFRFAFNCTYCAIASNP